jgi:broad specificity phosphatase PhoE
MMEIYLIRHGQTEWSLSGKHTGSTDIALTERGEQDARALAPILARLRFARVFTSPRERARHTCELAGLGANAEVEPDLTEWDYGSYEGLRSAEIHQQRPGWNVFRDGCPGGESVEAIASRADRLIARLVKLEGRIALFSHGHFGRTFAARWVDAPVSLGAHLDLGPATLSILGHEASHPEVQVISLWNQAPNHDAVI